jgi:predicted DNA-binding transcriptional regulator AlpA
MINEIKDFDSLPDAAHVRLPVVQSLYSCSTATIWRMVKSGVIPSPKRLTPNISAWNVGELRANIYASSNTPRITTETLVKERGRKKVLPDRNSPVVVKPYEAVDVRELLAMDFSNKKPVLQKDEWRD